MKKFLILALFASLFLSVEVFAHAQEEATTSVEVRIDLEIENPGTLPTSPFYFLKEWRRAIRIFFTFDRVKKAELELEISNEKAAEAKKVEEENPNNLEAIQRALENYRRSQERLRARLEALSDISENPQVEALLERLEERTEKHEQLFERISEKFEDHEEIRDISRQAKEKLGELREEARKEIVCTQEYNPVCGRDDRTYSNACHARRAKVEVKHEGECPKRPSPPANTETPLRRLENRLREDF